MSRLRLCRDKDCWVYFKRKSRQIYCGSAKLKSGCAYKNRLRLNAEWNKRHREITRVISAKWLMKHREFRNASRRTPEYHVKVKRYTVNKYALSRQ